MHSWHASGQLVGTLSWRQVHGETPPLTVRQLELDPSHFANRLRALVYKKKKKLLSMGLDVTVSTRGCGACAPALSESTKACT